MGFKESLHDELKFLLSGKGMPYEKVCIMVAMVISVILSVLLSGNFGKDAPVVIIDVDNSRYSRELVTKIDASEYMKVTAVVNTPVKPEEFFYRDQATAVVYFPQGLEKNRYTKSAAPIGVFYDNTNTALSADIKGALNEIVAIENAMASGSGESSGLTLNTRILFNPAGSTSNAQTQGFLFFFGSMFFVFATIGMIPRLRLGHQYEQTILHGTPWDLVGRIAPYCFFLIVSSFLGLAVLRVWGDLVFSGRVVEFLLIQVFMTLTIGVLSIWVGWTAANPGIASSRMILFIPGGFIFGGVTSPLTHFSGWVVDLAHIFPLTWQFHFTRDIIQRGASLPAISSEIGAFFIYMAIVGILFTWRFNKSRAELLASQSEKVEEVQTPTVDDEISEGEKIKNILVPTDGSGQAFKALLKAIQVAQFYEAKITLLMCVELEKEVSAFEQVSLSGYIPTELNIAAHDFLSDLMLVVPSDIKVKTRVEIGDPAETILDFAKYEKINLIVMGKSGLKTLGTENTGSVANYVKENAPCQVVLVEGMPDDWADDENFLEKKSPQK